MIFSIISPPFCFLLQFEKKNKFWVKKLLKTPLVLLYILKKKKLQINADKNPLWLTDGIAN